MNLGQKVKHQLFSFEVRRGSGSKSKPAVRALSLGARIVLLVETLKEKKEMGRGRYFSPLLLPLSFFQPSTYPKGRYFYPPHCCSVIKTKVAATTILT